MFKRILVALLAFFAFSVFAADANNASQEIGRAHV